MTRKIKKAFEPIITLLQANPGAKVKDILEQAIDIAAAKAGAGGGKASTFHKVGDTVVGVFCYYHKLWMDPRVVEFGAKSTSPTGLNTMCKDGANKWSKQQRDKKAIDEQLLSDVIAGTIAPDAVEAERAKRVEELSAIVPREDGYGFESLEDLLADSAKRDLPAVDETASAHDEH